MLIKRNKGWELPESQATPEAVFRSRRQFMVGAAGTLALGGGYVSSGVALAADAADPSAGLYPAQRNMRFRLDRDITNEKAATTYNNFYEFGTSKNIWEAAQKLPLRPWEIKIDGMVE